MRCCPSDAHSNSHPPTYCNAYTKADRNTYRNADAGTNGHTCSHAIAYGHPRSNAYSDRNSRTDTDSYADTRSSPHNDAACRYTLAFTHTGAGCYRRTSQ